jgi:hypothetical protein
MSIVIQANDKKFYESPLWHGKFEGNTRWVLNYFEQFILHVEGSKDVAPAILKNWPVVIGRGKKVDCGCFPPDWERTEAYRIPIKFTGMPPKPTDGTIRRWAPMDDLRFCWKVEFPTADVHAYLLGKAKRYNNFLNAFVAENDLLGDSKVNRVRLRLRKQFKAMTEMSLEQAMNEFGNYVEVDRP